MQEGFFETSTVATKKKASRKVQVYDCERCGLSTSCMSPKMGYTGKGKRKTLIIAEAPRATDDQRGKHFLGPEGDLLRTALMLYGFDLDRDFWSTSAVACRTPGDKEPTDLQVLCCASRWKAVVEELQPEFIWLMGSTALESFYNGRIDNSFVKLASWRRWCIPDRKYNCWVIPMFDPATVLKTKDRDEILLTVFNKDVQWARTCMKREPPVFENFDNRVRILKDANQIIRKLQQVNDCVCVFDYETTGLKPYREGHRVMTVGYRVAGERFGYAFPLQWPEFWNKKDRLAIENSWKRILRDPSVFKVAHNMQFEEAWSRTVLQQTVSPWHMDTRLVAHLLDVREGLTGLKLQSFLRWGVEEYDDKVKPFITKISHDDFNMIDQAPLDDVLHYNCLDAILEEKLYQELHPRRKQIAEINHLFHEGSLAFADMEAEGIGGNEKYFRDTVVSLEAEVELLTADLLTSNEARRFKKKYGREIAIGDKVSQADLQLLFYELLKYKPLRNTPKSSKPSLDEKAMKSFRSDFAKKLLRRKKIKDKWVGTYLKGFINTVVDGRIHPFFNLHRVSTLRSSSDSPNFQNIPKRDKEAMGLIRGGIVPRKGFEIMSADYKQIEVCSQSWYSNDKVLIDYVSNPKSDMHRDAAIDIFILPKNEISKPLRQIAKNKFVFPEFYGDYYRQCAGYIWEELNQEAVIKTASEKNILDHLAEHGIISEDTLGAHLQEVEKKFWNRFSATREWRTDVIENYKDTLMVESHFGGHRNGYLRRNQIVNTNAQMTAFHCLLWSLIEINKVRKQENWKSKIIGQIHDQIVFELWPSEKKHVLQVVEDIMCTKIKEGRPWIITPLAVEFEFSGVNNSWAVSEES